MYDFVCLLLPLPLSLSLSCSLLCIHMSTDMAAWTEHKSDLGLHSSDWDNLFDLFRTCITQHNVTAFPKPNPPHSSADSTTALILQPTYALGNSVMNIELEAGFTLPLLTDPAQTHQALQRTVTALLTAYLSPVDQLQSRLTTTEHRLNTAETQIKRLTQQIKNLETDKKQLSEQVRGLRLSGMGGGRRGVGSSGSLNASWDSSLGLGGCLGGLEMSAEGGIGISSSPSQAKSVNIRGKQRKGKSRQSVLNPNQRVCMYDSRYN